MKTYSWSDATRQKSGKTTPNSVAKPHRGVLAHAAAETLVGVEAYLPGAVTEVVLDHQIDPAIILDHQSSWQEDTDDRFLGVVQPQRFRFQEPVVGQLFASPQAVGDVGVDTHTSDYLTVTVSALPESCCVDDALGIPAIGRPAASAEERQLAIPDLP
jgi:hypothetical protein